MEVFKYRGKTVNQAELSFIKQLIADNPKDSRNALSKKLCEAWGWVQANGQLRDMVCRSFMLELHRADLIQLPEPRRNVVNNAIKRHKRERFLIDMSPLGGKLSELGTIEFHQVRNSGYEEKLFDSLIEEHHYLGYSRSIGEHLKFLVYAGGRPVACFAWSSATRQLGIRDSFIEWSVEARKSNIHLVAYNTRFLILPWVSVPHLASHLLGRMCRSISRDWQAFYNHPIYYLESFVDCERFKGTSYKAANWLFLGKTSGRGTRSKGPEKVPIKEILGYPLTRNFRKLLTKVP